MPMVFLGLLLENPRVNFIISMDSKEGLNIREVLIDLIARKLKRMSKEIPN